MKPLKASLILGTVLLFGSATLTTAAAKSYYKWVDRHGTTHYSEHPPSKSVKDIKLVRTQGWSNTAPTSHAATMPEKSIPNPSTPMPPLPSQPTPADESRDNRIAPPTPNPPAKAATAPATEPTPPAPKNANPANNSPAL